MEASCREQCCQDAGGCSSATPWAGRFVPGCCRVLDAGALQAARLLAALAAAQPPGAGPLLNTAIEDLRQAAAQMASLAAPYGAQHSPPMQVRADGVPPPPWVHLPPCLILSRLHPLNKPLPSLALPSSPPCLVSRTPSSPSPLCADYLPPLAIVPRARRSNRRLPPPSTPPACPSPRGPPVEWARETSARQSTPSMVVHSPWLPCLWPPRTSLLGSPTPSPYRCLLNPCPRSPPGIPAAVADDSETSGQK